MRFWLLALFALAFPARADVVISGVEGELLKSLSAGISIATLSKNSSARLVKRRHAQAREQLRTGLQAFGYYSPRIQPSLDIQDDGWQARYIITPGHRHRWTSSDVVFTPDEQESGEPDWLPRVQQQAARLQDREVDHRDYRQLKSRFIESAQEDGYLDAQFEKATLEVDLETGLARPVLHLKGGPRYRFGKIRIHQPILDDDFLQRFNPLQEGTVFHANDLLELRLRLYDLNYFSEVALVPTRLPEQRQVDIDIEASPRKPQRWQLGFGYGTDTGPRVSSSVEFRYLNRRGHAADAEATISEVRTALGLRYTLPTGPEPGANWAFRTQRLTEKLGDTETTTLRTGLSRNRVLTGRLWNYYLNYEGERFRFSGDETQTDLVIPGISLTLRRWDDLLLPRRGHTLLVDVHGAWDELLSSTSFIQAQVNGSWIHPVSARSRLVVRGRAGANWLKEFSALPASQRFFAGGDNSIRGYDYRRVAPRDSNGDVIGGKYLQTLSVEADRLIWRDYGLAVFHDMGSASNNWLSNIVSATGVGLRWATPIGMVRADFAVPHDDPNTRFQVHIGIGGEL